MEKKKINLKEIIGSEISNIIQGCEVIRWDDIKDQIINQIRNYINTKEFNEELMTIMSRKGYIFQINKNGRIDNCYLDEKINPIKN